MRSSKGPRCMCVAVGGHSRFDSCAHSTQSTQLVHTFGHHLNGHHTSRWEVRAYRKIFPNG